MAKLKCIWRACLDPNLATAVLLGVATVLFLVISLATPIIKGTQVFRLWATVGQSRQYVTFGLWGYCIARTPDTISVLVGCSRTKFGITIEDDVIQALQVTPSLRPILNKHLTSWFILYPLDFIAPATLSTLITCLIQICFYVSKSKRKPLLGFDFHNGRTYARMFTIGSIAMFTALVASVIQIAIVGKAKLRVTDLRADYGNIYLEWGNVIWFTVVGTIIHFFNLVNLFVMRLKLVRMEVEKIRARRRRRVRKINEIKEEDLINPRFSPETVARAAPSSAALSERDRDPIQPP